MKVFSCKILLPSHRAGPTAQALVRAMLAAKVMVEVTAYVLESHIQQISVTSIISKLKAKLKTTAYSLYLREEPGTLTFQPYEHEDLRLACL